MATLTLEVSPESLAALRRSPAEFVREMRIAAAIYWYTRGEVSQSAAADIAGMHRIEFLDELARRRIDVFQVDGDDLQRELDRG